MPSANALPALTLAAVDPGDEDALRARHVLASLAQQVDRPEDPPPSWNEQRAELRHPWPGTRTAVWLARHGDTVVGEAALALPTLDNLDNAFVDVTVAPAYRRAGIGRGLLEHLAEQARAAGRLRLMAEACAAGPAGEGAGAAFAAAVGATPALIETCRRLALPADEAVLTRLGGAAEAAGRAGYDLLQWTGPTPPEWADDVAELTGRMSTDAPLDDLHLAPKAYDARRIRDRDGVRVARGMRAVVTAARHRATGRLVAFTDIVLQADVPWHGGQCDTIVAPEHRGHRLGTWIKVANLEAACRERPALTAVDTWNADSNPWMVAINEAMGFRPLRRWTEWELEL